MDGQTASGAGRQDKSTDDSPLKKPKRKRNKITIYRCKGLCQKTEVLKTEEKSAKTDTLNARQQQTEDTVLECRNVPKFSHRQVWANSVDPDQTAPRGSGSALFAIPSAPFGRIILL